MRPIEIFVSAANLLTFFSLSFPQIRTTPWASYGVLIALLLTIIQVVFEGPRWQMVPAYALMGLFFLVWLLQTRTSGLAGPLFTNKLVLGVTIGFSLLGLLISIALPMLLPVFRFPPPNGPYQIGTLTYHWIDANRQERFSADLNAPRELMAQVWYPAKEGASAAHVPYVENPAIFVSIANLLHLPGFTFDHLKYVTTHAVHSAPLADKEDSYPVLIFLSGRSGYRQSNTFQVEELVSHGYIVVAIDQPYAASGVIFPDGRLITMDSRMYPAHPNHDLFLDEVIPFLAQDVSFTLDQLAALNLADPNGILTGRLDLQHMGIFGVSLGGIVTGEACLQESRLRACLVLDAFMPASVVESGLQQPTMWISRDEETMQREGWQQADIDETQNTMRTVYASLPGDGYLVLVPGMFHPDFTDAPLFSPLASVMGLSGSYKAQRIHTIINAYSLAFFDRHLKEQPTILLDGPVRQYPEVLFETRQP